jgi:hypothetical protein
MKCHSDVAEEKSRKEYASLSNNRPTILCNVNGMGGLGFVPASASTINFTNIPVDSALHQKPPSSLCSDNATSSCSREWMAHAGPPPVHTCFSFEF